MTSSGYFDRLYGDDPDPWNLASSPYERRKLALLMASLPEARYHAAFEPGCAIGVTTAALAARCDRVLAMDGASAAVEQARRRVVRAGRYVHVVQGQVPADWPIGQFDLVVLSELLYYLGADQRRELQAHVVDALAPGGDVVAVHWRHAFREATCNGDQVHDELADRLSGADFAVRVDHVEEHFRLQVYRAPGGPERRQS